jgi:rubrerythrin
MSERRRLVRIFEYALNQEETGLSFFETSIERMGIGSAVGAFEKLIEEEKRHIAFIRSILAKLRRNRDLEVDAAPTEEIELVTTDFFDKRARKEFIEQCVTESMVPDVTIFNMAWLIEKDLCEFYTQMAEKSSGKAQKAFETLAGWEARHERFFREYRDKLTEIYSNMPWGG